MSEFLVTKLHRKPWKLLFAGVLACALVTHTPIAVSDPDPTGGAADTVVTPVPKSTKLWTLVAGAEAGADDVLAGSPTPFTLDLFAVAFRNKEHGLAGGAQCIDNAAPVATCARQPVIYRYEDIDGLGPRWQEAARFPGRGFVGAIDWMGPGQALAVGGDGCYPRREVPCADGTGPPAGSADVIAGNARAWLLKDGVWCEIAPAGQPDNGCGNLPAGMRGLTALDFSPEPSPLAAFGVAGGLGQLWEFKDDRFDPDVIDANSGRITARPLDSGNSSTYSDTTTPADFKYRVRDIRAMVSPGGVPIRTGRILAATAGTGCCDATPGVGHAVVLSLGQAGWTIYGAGASDPRRPSAYVIGAILGVTNGEYATADGPSVVTNADGPEQPEEPSSDIGGGQLAGDGLVGVRLVAADGDAPHPAYDWYVGAATQSGASEGVAYNSGQAVAPPPSGIDQGNPQHAQPPSVDAGQVQKSQESYRVLKLGSYGLNAFREVNETSGIGWAVGDRGAIVSLGETAHQLNATAEPDPPTLGVSQPAHVPFDAPYDAFRPLAAGGASSPLPGLAEQPLETVSPPARVAAGSPDPEPAYSGVSEIVMSRDGSEGWALGGPYGPGLYHYDGTGWTACPFGPRPAGLPVDPHCAGLDKLAGRDLHIASAARVPWENADDPERSDDFEIVAVGSMADQANRAPLVLRYREGTWSIETGEATRAIDRYDDGLVPKLQSVAFTAPDDGWMVGASSAPTNQPRPFYHYDGTRWVDCLANRDACFDPDGRLPVDAPSGGPGPADDLQFAAVGRRVYLSGYRTVGGSTYPVIIYRDPGGAWTAAHGGFDPGIDQVPGGSQTSPSDLRVQGQIQRLAVGSDGKGGVQGWAVGEFGPQPNNGGGGTVTVNPDARLMRLAPGSDTWVEWQAPDAAADYLIGNGGQSNVGATRPTIATVTGPTPFGSAFVASSVGPLLGFDDARQRWRVVETPASPITQEDPPYGAVQVVASDNRGGLWVTAGGPSGSGPGSWFYDYTDRRHRAVFDDTPQPLQQEISALAGSPDGRVWVATKSDQIARYDRVTGWMSTAIPGWDAGRLVTVHAPVRAIAIGAGGAGLAVGPAGRIADLDATARLDAAAGAPHCDLPPAAPVCGTGRDLWAAAVGPDDSAMVGGDSLALLWRRAGGGFQPIARPLAAANARITGIALPQPDRAWLTLDTGQVFAGHLADGDWSWELENVDTVTDDVLSADGRGGLLAVRAIVLDHDGRGYAVGDHGLVLERDPSAPQPWTRIDTGFADDLTTVALATGSGSGAVIGGKNGLILTLRDGRFEVARGADLYGDGRAVVGLALMPGVKPGQAEAWAGLGGLNGGGAVLHYTSDPDDPLLNPERRAAPLPDAPGPRDGEIVFAAFGKSDCHLSTSTPCDAVTGLALPSDVVQRRIVQEVIEHSGRPGGPRFAVFTGDINAAGGDVQHADAGHGRVSANAVARWAEMVADPLRDGGVPVFGAIGGQDGTTEYSCNQGGCYSPNQATSSAGVQGPNVAWRQGLAGQPAPWGAGNALSANNLSFTPVADSTGSTRSPVAGARTHYAVDVKRGDDRLVRLVFVDNSQRSLQASDPGQDPAEPGGQQAWLQQMTCTDATTGCTRTAKEQAVVVANAPSYSYGPGTQNAVATDAASFEQTLITNRVNLGVSGHIGWNGLYWALAAGVHDPCPGGHYPSGPPDLNGNVCGQTTDAPSVQQRKPPAAAGQLAESLGTGVTPPALPTTDSVFAGALPFVVASGAGGKLASATGEGEWHGYTLVRLDKTGDPRQTIVEQRPVFDWIQITATERTLRPGQRLPLNGVGREPTSITEPPRFDPIDSPAITHRFDLLEADPDRPYLPRRDASGDYVPISPSVATIDPQSGQVTAQRSAHSRAYAIAVLSVDDRTATYPMVFEPSRSFVPRTVRIVTPPALAPIRTLGFTAQSLTAPTTSPPPAAPPVNTTVVVPTPPTLPSFSPPSTTQAPSPPPPPAPPAPPASQHPTAMNLSISPVGVAVPPTTGVTAQPTPPVNPSPPSGARREAKQRQAATAKSEEGGETGASQDAHGGSDLAQQDVGAHGAGMTRATIGRRHPPSGAYHPFTAVRARAQPSAWVLGLEWGGGIGLMALALALGFATLRPTPRRRPHGRGVTPVPAWVRRRGS
jgi:hypothetical protein